MTAHDLTNVDPNVHVLQSAIHILMVTPVHACSDDYLHDCMPAIALRVFFFDLVIILVFVSMQTWIFQKANIPEATEEVEGFAVKLMKHGVSLLDYSRSLVSKASYR